MYTSCYVGIGLVCSGKRMQMHSTPPRHDAVMHPPIFSVSSLAMDRPRPAERAAFGITAVCIVALFLARSVIGVLFGASAEANAGITARLPLFLATLPLLAYTRVTIAYFYATEKTALSYVLVFSEPVLTFAVLLILPQLFKLTGVWLAIPAAQALTFCIAVPERRRTQRARELPA